MTTRSKRKSDAPTAPAPYAGQGVVWLLMPGGAPRLASKVTPKEAERATAWCREGDSTWERIQAPAGDVDTGGLEP